MPKYRIYSSVVVSTYDVIDAHSAEEAIQMRYDKGWRALMFVDHSYPDVGDWEVDEDAEQLL